VKLSIQNLSKQYSNGIKAMDHINLEIGNGMFGLLGPNGAGKSTLMRTIATLQEADSGLIALDGMDIFANKDALRKQLGYLPQEFGVYPKISAYDMLHHIATLKGISEQKKDIVHDLLHKVNLYEFRKKNVHDFSGGMKQRFGIAQALIGDPNLLIVDEPTAGLDPTERNRFHNILAEIAENKIVILSTHIVQDIIELCNDMAIINSGQVKFKGNPSEALAILKDKVYGRFVDKNEIDSFRNTFHVLSEKLYSGKNYMTVYSEQHAGEGFEARKADLEDVFFYLCNNA
jgi:ABC-type multidrug transport system ATPase subunit